jgi:hypothetical protein
MRQPACRDIPIGALLDIVADDLGVRRTKCLSMNPPNLVTSARLAGPGVFPSFAQRREASSLKRFRQHY